MKIRDEIINKVSEWTETANLIIKKSTDLRYGIYETFETARLSELCLIRKTLETHIKELEDEVSRLKKAKEYLKLTAMPDLMAENEISSIEIKGVGKLSAEIQTLVSIKEGKKEEAYKWLDENGNGDLIKETVHSNTLQATVKKLLEDEQGKEENEKEFPEHLFNIVKRTITKLKG